MADAGNTGTAGDKDSKASTIIHNHFQGATIGNLANQAQDGASQNYNAEKLCSTAPEPAPQLPTELSKQASGRMKADLKLKGELADLTPERLVSLQRALAVLKEITNDVSWQITGLEQGCIRLTLEGSEEGARKLRELADSGKLAELFGELVEDVRIADAPAPDSADAANDPVKVMLLDQIRSGQTNLLGARLFRANLSGADLSEADLRGAKLRGADLRGAKLRGANLRGANLFRANLIGANLRGADLSGAHLIRANLSEVNLSGAHLIRANLSEVNLSGARLFRADLSGANLRGARLFRADLSGADLRGANLSEANLSEANLSGANLRGARLFRADLSGADLRDANVEDAIFSGTRGLTELTKADLKFRGAIFEDSPGDRSSISTPAPIPR